MKSVIVLRGLNPRCCRREPLVRRVDREERERLLTVRDRLSAAGLGEAEAAGLASPAPGGPAADAPAGELAGVSSGFAPARVASAGASAPPLTARGAGVKSV